MSLAELSQHKLAFSKVPGGRTDGMSRRDDADDYVVSRDDCAGKRLRSTPLGVVCVPLLHLQSRHTYLQVVDPLLEKAKGKFSKAAQKKKKQANEWAGRSNV